MRLLLTRHGQSAWNVQQRYQGQSEAPLSPLGEEQARRLGARLSPQPLDAVYASDLERAWRTAELLVAGRGLAVQRDPAWRERAFGTWEGLTRSEIATRDPAGWARLRADWAAAPGGGETGAALQQRVVAAVERLRERHRGQTVLVVTHSGCLVVLWCWLHRVPLGGRDFPPNANGALCSVRWDGEAPAVELWNDLGHAPAGTTAAGGESLPPGSTGVPPGQAPARD